MIINLKMHFTNKCNYKCEHCMFSCNSIIKEDRNKILNLASEVKKFLEGYNYRLNLYGGESFLDITLLEEYINNLINKNCICYSIPTNGYFLDNDKLLRQIDNLFTKKINTKEKSKIIISTSKYHQEQWSKAINDVIHNITRLKKYNNFYSLLEIQNTFITQRILPYGRAKDIHLKHINPQIHCDLFEYSNDLEITINPNGDISFCDFGYKIGNIHNLSIEKILNIRFKSLKKNKYKIFRKLNNVCQKCVGGKYICVK